MNKYRLVFLLFLVWIVFFDTKNVYVQFKLSKKIHELKKEQKEYESMYETIKGEHKDLTENIEKFAREKYYMHKENEEVFIIK
ncbi:MAG: FtsB family cell division protein [Deltaproteobacteria bacterium]